MPHSHSGPLARLFASRRNTAATVMVEKGVPSTPCAWTNKLREPVMPKDAAGSMAGPPPVPVPIATDDAPGSPASGARS